VRPLGSAVSTDAIVNKEIGCEDMDWIDLAQDMGKWQAAVNTVMKLQVP
jgi:hypothetical protein